MVEVAAGCDAGVVVMHMLGEPKTMQDEPHYDDVVREVGGYLLAQAAVLEAAGVARERIAIDPGIGFGKTLEHNLALLRALPELAALGYPVVVGASRKRFIGELTGVAGARRAGRRLASPRRVRRCTNGAAVVRVHDVARDRPGARRGGPARSARQSTPPDRAVARHPRRCTPGCRVHVRRVSSAQVNWGLHTAPLW